MTRHDGPDLPPPPLWPLIAACLIVAAAWVGLILAAKGQRP